MKIIAALSLACSLLLGSPASAAGVGSTGGGKAIVCRDHRNRIKSVEVLDLWEARELHGLKIPSSKEPVEKQIDTAVELLKNVTYYPIVESSGPDGQSKTWRGPEALAHDLRGITALFTEIASGVVRLHGKKLKLTDDSLEEAYPNGCQPEQVVIFHDQRGGLPNVLVNQDLVDRMDAQNRAALYVHEALYHVLRRLDGEENSLRVRRAVGLAFSGHAFKKIQDVFPDDLVACYSDMDQANRTAIVVFQHRTPSNDEVTVFKPLIVGGVFLTDITSSLSSIGSGTKSLDEFLAKVLSPPVSGQPTTYSGLSILFDRAFIDREVNADLERLTFEGTDKFALAINHVTTPWQKTPTTSRTYLTCVRAKKSDIFH